MKAILVGICVLFLFAATASATDYYVDALNGSDKAGNGSLRSPWKTITRSLGQMGKNNTLHVMPGRYDSGNGEESPLDLWEGTSLIGSSARDCIIDGGWHYTIIMTDGCDVANLTVKGRAKDGVAIAAFGSYWFEPFEPVSGLSVFNCIIQGNGNGIWFLFCEDVHIGGNYFVGVANDNIIIFAAVDWYWNNVRIFNNTLDGTRLKSPRAIVIARSGSSIIKTHIYNNSITNFTKYGIDVDAQSAKAVTLEYNNLRNNLGNYSPSLKKGKTDISVDPVFVNAAAGNLHLAPTSPLVDKGLNKLAPTRDGDGTPRPQGKATDIGADELVYDSRVAAIADFHVFNQATPGATLDFVVLGVPRDAGAFAISLLRQSPATPLPVGPLHLNPGAIFYFLPLGLDARGVGTHAVPIPNVPSLVGLDFYAQAYSGRWLTRLETIHIR